MALVPIRIPRTSKPPLGTPIDWSNPQQGVISAWAFNESAGRKIYGLGGVLTVSAGGWNGDGYQTDGTTSSGGLTLANASGASAFNFEEDFTIILEFSIQDTAGASHALICKGLVTTPYPFAIHFDYPNNRWFFLRYGSTGTPVSAIMTHGVAKDITKMAFGKCGGNLFCCTYNKGSVLYQTVTDTTTGTHANTQPLTLGMRDNGYFQAKNTYKSLTVYPKALPISTITDLFTNPWQIYEPEIVWVNGGGETGATTSTADPDSIDVTGTAATDYRGLISGATVGAITATGTAATSTKGHVSVAETGAVTVSGVNVADYRTLISIAEAGAATATGANTADYISHVSATQTSSITATGIDSTGVYTPVGSTTSIAQPGVVTIIGVNASGLRTLISLTEPGAVNLTGVNASGFRGLLSVTETGALAVTGVNSTDTTGALTSIAPYSPISVNGYNTTDYRPGREIPIFSGRTIPITSGRELSLTSGRTIPVIQ